MINIIVADDHQVMVEGLVSLLREEKDIEVVDTAINGDDVVQLLDRHSIDVAVLDIEMPGLNGVQLTKLIRQKYSSVKVLILTMYKTKEFVKQIINAGAHGYILKNKGSEEIVKAIRHIHEGNSYVGQEITAVLFDALREQSEKDKQPSIKLTKREKEVLALIIKGYTSPQIGQELFIAPSTVDTHRRNLIDKTGVANSRGLIAFAIDNKLV